MVGTSAIAKMSKVKFQDVPDEQDKYFVENQNNLQVNCEEKTFDVSADSPDKLIDDIINNKLNNRRKIQRGQSFKNFYHLGIFILFFVASFILVCAIKNMALNEKITKESSLPGVLSFAYGKASKAGTQSWPDPPPHEDLAAVARYVMHISNWGSLSTFSTHEGLETYPFVNVFSISDGTVENSTGIPYFYLTPLELSVKDLNVNNKVSFTVSEAQSNYCSQNGFDPEDPRCAHIIFTGEIRKLEKNSKEEQFARLALFSRHKEMETWPVDHAWFFAKLEIVHIYVLDYFGGVGVVTPEDYFAAKPFP